MSKFAIVIGMGLALSSWAVLAQNPTAAPEHPASEVAGAPPQAAAPAEPASAVVPLDQQPTKEQLARLFEVMRVKEQLASMTKMMPALMQQAMQTQFKQMQKDHPEMAPTNEEQQQAVSKIMGRYMERVMNLYTAEDMAADMAILYQKHLTRSDVDGMIGFYSSPAGQHMLDMVPVIMREYIPLIMQKMNERVTPALNQMKKEMEELAKPSTPAAATPAAK
jgi:hypothetical protein